MLYCAHIGNAWRTDTQQGPIVGKLYDNYGPRWILLAGTFFHVFGLLMTSVSTEYYQFILAQGICSPIGASMVFYPCLSLITSSTSATSDSKL